MLDGLPLLSLFFLISSCRISASSGRRQKTLWGSSRNLPWWPLGHHLWWSVGWQGCWSGLQTLGSEVISLKVDTSEGETKDLLHLVQSSAFSPGPPFLRCVFFSSSQWSLKSRVLGSLWEGLRPNPAGWSGMLRQWAFTGPLQEEWLGQTQLWPYWRCWGYLWHLCR